MNYLLDTNVVSECGQRAGRQVGAMDGLLAATAVANELTLVTRNERDFEGLGVRTFNPWRGQLDQR